MEKSSGASPTEHLSHFVAGLKFASIPPEVVAHLKLCIVDTLGCALYGSTLPWGNKIIQFVKECGAGRGALIWCDGTEVPSPNAPFANGTLVHSFELDDIHRDAVLHPGATTVPAADALTRDRHLDGKTFLTAIAAGYETGCRIGLVNGASQLRRGFHPTGTTGTFAAAAAAAKMLNLDAGKTQHALGIAGTQGAGLMAAQEGAMVKRMHPGRAAQSGVYAALLAAEDFTGITNILEAPFGGFFSTLADRWDSSRATQNLGQEFVSLNVGFKIYPCCANNHPSLDALSRIRAQHPRISAQDAEKIVVRTTRTSKLHVGWPYQPESITTAQMNLSYCLSAALVDSEFTVDQVTEESIRRPAILDAARRIEVVEDPELEALGDKYRYATKLEVYLQEGKRLEEKVLQAKGSEENPLTSEEVVSKFRRLAGKVLRKPQIERLIQTVLELEKMDDASGLSELMCPAE